VSDLLERAEAALRLLEEDATVDPLLVLSYVLWPTATLLAVSPAPPRRKRPVSEAEAARMVELEAKGLSHRAIAEELGRTRPTVSDVLRRLKREGLGRGQPAARSRHSSPYPPFPLS
jgi:CRP-like cAMP-binding protein